MNRTSLFAQVTIFCIITAGGLLQETDAKNLDLINEKSLSEIRESDKLTTSDQEYYIADFFISETGILRETETPTYLPSVTPSAPPSFTSTPIPTITVSPYWSPTGAITPPTETPVESPTFSSTPTAFFTHSPTSTNTATPTPTPTGFSTVTEVPTLPTATATASPTFSSTGTPYPTTSVTLTNTPDETATPTPTVSSSGTPVPTLIPTNAFTFTSTPTETMTFSPTGTAVVTPTAELTRTIAPTMSQTPTPRITLTPTLPPLGVILELSEEDDFCFRTGDLFRLDAWISNPGPEEYEGVPFVVLLDIDGEYWWYPEWSSDFTYAQVELPSGTKKLRILDFIWPDDPSEEDDVRIYAALLNYELTDFFAPEGDYAGYDYVEFDYGCDCPGFHPEQKEGLLRERTEANSPARELPFFTQ